MTRRNYLKELSNSSTEELNQIGKDYEEMQSRLKGADHLFFWLEDNIKHLLGYISPKRQYEAAIVILSQRLLQQSQLEAAA
jgi:hypothetical protein